MPLSDDLAALERARVEAVPPSMCPWCGYFGDRLLCYREYRQEPHAGDASICVGCGGIAIFDAELNLEKMTGEHYPGMWIPDPAFGATVLNASARIVAERKRMAEEHMKTHPAPAQHPPSRTAH